MHQVLETLVRMLGRLFRLTNSHLLLPLGNVQFHAELFLLDSYHPHDKSL